VKTLFIVTTCSAGAWLSEISHPYWQLTERGVEVDFASPDGGEVSWTPVKDPYRDEESDSAYLYGIGSLSDKDLTAKLKATLVLREIDLAQYDAVHVAGGWGVSNELYSSEDVRDALDYFWAQEKVVGAICQGAIALGNVPPRVRCRHFGGLAPDENLELEQFLEPRGRAVARHEQESSKPAGTLYISLEPSEPWVVIDEKVVTGQNRQSPSEYALVFFHAMAERAAISGR
jgi:putative intracellular protease/amidase